MQYFHEFDRDRALCVVCIRGLVTGYGIESSIKDWLKHPYWSPGTNFLIDCREAVMSHLRYDDVVQISSMVEKVSDGVGHCRVALLVSGKGIDMGMANMYAYHTNPNVKFEIEVFRSLDECYQWVDYSGGFG